MRNLFADTANSLFSEQLSPEIVSECEDGRWLKSLWLTLEGNGFCAAASSENLGGLEASWGDVYALVSAAGYHNAPVPLGETIFANWVLGRLGIHVLSGPIAFPASSNAIMSGGLVTGEIQSVPWGRHVEHCLVIVEQGGAPQCVVLATKDAKRIDETLNTANEPRDTLVFEAATPVSMAPLGSALPSHILQLGGALIRCAQIGGGLERALDLTVGYSGERVQFGRPIMKFQAVQQQVAILAEQTAMIRIAAEAAFCESHEALAVSHIMAAKICAGEASNIAVPISHAVHGAIGFTYEYSLHLTTRRLMSWANEFGTTTQWAQKVGQRVCENGEDKFWPRLVAGQL